MPKRRSEDDIYTSIHVLTSDGSCVYNLMSRVDEAFGMLENPRLNHSTAADHLLSQLDSVGFVEIGHCGWGPYEVVLAFQGGGGRPTRLMWAFIDMSSTSVPLPQPQDPESFLSLMRFRYIQPGFTVSAVADHVEASQRDWGSAEEIPGWVYPDLTPLCDHLRPVRTNHPEGNRALMRRKGV